MKTGLKLLISFMSISMLCTSIADTKKNNAKLKAPEISLSDAEIVRAAVCPITCVVSPTGSFFCDVQVRNSLVAGSLCTPGNAQIGGDLTVCGAEIINGPIIINN